MSDSNTPEARATLYEYQKAQRKEYYASEPVEMPEWPLEDAYLVNDGKFIEELEEMLNEAMGQLMEKYNPEVQQHLNLLNDLYNDTDRDTREEALAEADQDAFHEVIVGPAYNKYIGRFLQLMADKYKEEEA